MTDFDPYSEKIADVCSLIRQHGQCEAWELFKNAENGLEVLCAIVDAVRAEAKAAVPVVPNGFMMVPTNPTEVQWSGLARDLIFAFRSSWKADEVLEFLTSIREEPLPQWLTDALPNASNHTISKGTCAVLIYRAVLHDAPDAPIAVAEQTKQQEAK